MISRVNFFDQPVNNDERAYNGQGDVVQCYRMVAADLRKQHALDSDLKTIQQIIFLEI